MSIHKSKANNKSNFSKMKCCDKFNQWTTLEWWTTIQKTGAATNHRMPSNLRTMFWSQVRHRQISTSWCLWTKMLTRFKALITSGWGAWSHRWKMKAKLLGPSMLRGNSLSNNVSRRIKKLAESGNKIVRSTSFAVICSSLSKWTAWDERIWIRIVGNKDDSN